MKSWGFGFRRFRSKTAVSVTVLKTVQTLIIIIVIITGTYRAVQRRTEIQQQCSKTMNNTKSGLAVEFKRVFHFSPTKPSSPFLSRFSLYVASKSAHSSTINSPSFRYSRCRSLNCWNFCTHNLTWIGSEELSFFSPNVYFFLSENEIFLYVLTHLEKTYFNRAHCVTVNCYCNWGTFIAPPTRRPRAHHRVNPYLGARR